METFVVRLWAPVEGDGCQPGVYQPGGPPLHGVVEHVGRNGSETFSGDRELVLLLRAGLRPDNRRPGTSTKERGAG